MHILHPPAQVDLVWNKGIAALCHRRIPDEFPQGVYRSVPTLAGAMSSRKLPENLIADPRIYRDIDNQIVWVRLSWLKSFIKQVLPLIDGQFVLATADSDSCVPSELREEAGAILQSPNVLHWFTQNYDGSMDSRKISPLPIGVDFHMQAEKPAWGEPQASPLEQEKQLRALASSLPNLPDRIPKVYVDFAWQKSFGFRHYRRFHPLKGTSFHESRRRTVKQVQNKITVFCQPASLPRNEMWQKRGQYAFVLSPHGMGLDCHRTWEALTLGHIVLVPSSSLDPMFSDLPVVPLKSWDEINPDNLTKWLALHGDSDPNRNPKLTSSYWIAKMKSTLDAQR